MSFWENFWDIFWWFIYVYAFFAFLFALFVIIGDIFRDQELNGWLKAVWIVFLAFLPFLGVLVYLIARGKGMTERADGTGPPEPGSLRCVHPPGGHGEPNRGDCQSQGPSGRRNHQP